MKEQIKYGSFLAYLDNGDTAKVSYTSKFIKEGTYENTITSCLYHGIDILPVFSYRRQEDMPLGIWYAIENNSISLWEKEYV